MHTDTHRMLMIDVDSADIDFIERHLDFLPTLRRLFTDGEFKRLESDGGELGASVWPSFLTGRRPGDHGQYFPLQWDADAMKLAPVGEDYRFHEPFWYEIARAGKPVIAFDVQIAFESRLPLGFEVHNWTAQSFTDLRTNRPELLDQIIRRFGRHPMGEDIPADWSTAERRRMKARITSGVRQTGEIIRWLMRHHEWRLFITSFVESHRAGHYLMAEDGERLTEGALLEIFVDIDRELAAIFGAADLSNTTVIVFSLEGMQPSCSQLHFMPVLMDTINRTYLSRTTGAPVPRHNQRNVMKLLRERVPSAWQGRVGRHTPSRVRDWVVGRQFSAGLDWNTTPGFALPCGGESFIRLNVQGRETRGVLAPGTGEIEAYCAVAEEVLRSFRHAATGAPLVKDILYTRDVFPGEKTHLLPDVIVVWQDQPPAREITSDTHGPLTARYLTGRQGLHCSRGFATALGAKAAPGVFRDTAHISDLAALTRTLLASA